MQTRTQSAIESIINVLVGYFFAILSQLLIFPMFDINIPISSNFAIAAWFTVLSLIRSYAIRRMFNK